MGYSTDGFFGYLDKNVRNTRSLINCPGNELDELLIKKRQQLRRVLKLDQLESYTKAITHQCISDSSLEQHRICQYEWTFLPNLTVPLWVIYPEQPNGDAILYCHGHDEKGAKGSFTKSNEDEGVYHKWLPLLMADRGYTVVVPEFIGFGEVNKSFRRSKNNTCYGDTQTLLLYGLNMAGIRVYEAMRAMDWIKDVIVPKHMVIYGVSGGGLITAYTSALDERIDASIISSYTNTFKDSIMAISHCVDNYVPDILEVGECPEIIALANPTPILLTNGKEDHIFPLEGTIKAIEDIDHIYDRFNSKDKVHIELFDGAHEVSTDKLFAFMEKVLGE